MIDVWKAFGKLGLTAFGGPVAHIGFFRQEFVVRRQWLTEQQFSQLLAICQFLPGPASSQMGFAIGLLRAGWLGAVAAFVAFTLPSALALFAFASLANYLDNASGQAMIQGLKLVAIAVVAHAVLGMSKSLCPDWPRRCIALLALLVLLVFSYLWMQLLVIVMGALLGLVMCRYHPTPVSQLSVNYSNRLAGFFALLFASLLLLSIILPTAQSSPVNVFASFYQAGALVFGGGHVVLPLLEQSTVGYGWVDTESFLAGYGAAQAVPGPLFTFASYLGAEIDTGLPASMGALIAIVGIFLPGFLLLLAVLPFWANIASIAKARAAIVGVNAAVVGLLAAALYDPIITSSLHHWTDAVIALIGFLMLSVLKQSALSVVCFCLAASLGVSMLPLLN